MSGIACLARPDGGPLEPGLIEAMAWSMAHRGPHGIDCRRRGSAALGHCMLRTTPESRAESQPLANEDGSLLLTWDGRLDNGEELRARLRARGARWRDRSDAELVLQAYEAWGRDCPVRMDGDFAFVIWDARQNLAFCARDRMAHRPLHYHWDGRCLAVASELHALLGLPWVEETLNEGLIAERLANDFRSLDETPWKGVLRLPPAHRMTVDLDGPRIERYWEPDLGVELRYKREEEYVEHYHALLEDAVRRHSRADGPLACEVSGGLDSSAVFAVGEELRRRGGLLAPDIEPYTLRFDGGAAGADLRHARAVASYLGRPLNEIAPTLGPLERDRVWARRYRDLPSAPHGTMHLGILETAVARGSRVVLGGVGGDQWLTGDHTYFAASLAAGRWREFLACLRRDADTHGLRTSLFLAARHGVVPLMPRVLRRRGGQILTRLRGGAADDCDWLAGPMARMLADRQARRPVAEADLQRPEHRQRWRYLSSASNLAANEVMERLAASVGADRRSPLDCAALVQFGFSVPHQWLLRNGWNRYLHRRTMSGLLPDMVAWRRDKAEFSIVFERHRAELMERLDDILSGPTEPWVSREGLRRLGSGPAAGRPRPLNVMLLWRLFACDALRPTSEASPKFGSPAWRRRGAVDRMPV